MTSSNEKKKVVNRSDGVVRPAGGGHPALQKLDPKTAFLYTPRTVTFLVLGLFFLIYWSGAFDPPVRPSDIEAAAEFKTVNGKRGLWSVIFVFLGYSVLQGPSTSMVRPHPAFWRLIHGVFVVYFLFLVWLLFQDVHDARQYMKYLSADLGRELPERSYGGDCRLWDENGIKWGILKDTVCDEFVLAHTFGWWGKALMIRNHSLLWVLSFGFEFMELTFQHMLPNFEECWWDSWILDVAMCNLIGIIAGMWTVHWFECRYKTYNWRGISEQPTIMAKAKRSILQFMPYSWDMFEWRIFSGPKRCLQILAMISIFLAIEVQAFFLKYILWVPPRNLLNTYRLCIWFAGGLPCIREYYEFLEGRSVDRTSFNKLGPFAWLGAATAFTEFLICFKFGRGITEFHKPWPFTVVVCWTIFAGTLCTVLVVWSIQLHFTRKKTKAE